MHFSVSAETQSRRLTVIIPYEGRIEIKILECLYVILLIYALHCFVCMRMMVNTSEYCLNIKQCIVHHESSSSN